MAACAPETMDVTKCRFLLWDALPDFHCSRCSFVGLWLQFCLHKLKSMLRCVDNRWLTSPLKKIPFLCLDKLLVCFVAEAAEEYSSVQFRIHPATFISSHIINKHEWLGCTCSHTCPHHKTASTIFDRWCGLMSCFSPSPCFFIRFSSWFRVFFFPQNCVSSFKCFHCKV